MQKRKVLIASSCHPVLIEHLELMGYECCSKIHISRQEALRELSEYEGFITSNVLPVDAALMDIAKNLKWIGRLGSGMEIIDVSYATKKGIACFNSPEGNANAVAEQALGMLLALANNLKKAQHELKNGLWLREENRGIEINGKTAGIIGLGHNGSCFAKKLMALGVKILAYDIAKNNYDISGIVGCSDLQPILEQADILSFHVPLTGKTHHYFNRDMLKKIQRPFILLNLSRGTVVEQTALFEGLQNGKIRGAALDVWEQEPFWKEKKSALDQQARRLLEMPNFMGTPHIGGYSYEALYKMSKILADKIQKFVETAN